MAEEGERLDGLIGLPSTGQAWQHIIKLTIAGNPRVRLGGIWRARFSPRNSSGSSIRVSPDGREDGVLVIPEAVIMRHGRALKLFERIHREVRWGNEISLCRAVPRAVKRRTVP